MYVSKYVPNQVQTWLKNDEKKIRKEKTTSKGKIFEVTVVVVTS
jgi:hypothetical protein